MWRLPLENSNATDISAKTATLEQNTKMLVLKDICAKWSHFSEQDVAALNGKAELATQLAAKYGLPQARAQREVDALLKGRQFGAGA